MNETIFITGGTGKIGSKFVEHFFKKNFNVIFTSLNNNDIENFLIKFKKTSKKNKLCGLKINLEENNFSKKIINFLNKNKLYPDHLINCARKLDYLKLDKNGKAQKKEFLGSFCLDVFVPYELSLSLVNQKNSRLKNIVNISSVYGIVAPNPNLYKNSLKDSPIQYGITKASQIHLTKELAVRLASKNIRINSISYGGVEGRVNEEFKKKYAQLCPLGRMLKEKEVVGAIDFLISKKSNYITGHNLVVDGGWTVW